MSRRRLLALSAPDAPRPMSRFVLIRTADGYVLTTGDRDLSPEFADVIRATFDRWKAQRGDGLLVIPGDYIHDPETAVVLELPSSPPGGPEAATSATTSNPSRP